MKPLIVPFLVVLSVLSITGFAQRGREDGDILIHTAKPIPRTVNPTEQATIDLVAEYYERMGMSNYADQVKKAFDEGKIVFDPNVRKEDPDTTAYTDTSDNTIHVDTAVAIGREAGPAGRANTASVASTLFHEFIHVEQGSDFINNNEKPVYETPAWTRQLDLTRSWLRNRISALDTSITDAKRVEILKDIVACNNTIIEVVEGLRANINKGAVVDPSLTDELLGKIIFDSQFEGNAMLLAYEGLLTSPTYGHGFGPFLKTARAFSESVAADPNLRPQNTSFRQKMKNAARKSANQKTDENETPSTDEDKKTSTILEQVDEVQVTAKGSFVEKSNQTINNWTITIRFWNVGALVPSREKATIRFDGKDGASVTFFGTFSGGPNGVIKFSVDEEEGIKTATLNDGKSVTGPKGAWVLSVDKPEAFKNWPVGAR